jgi:TonB family protein
MIEPTTLTVAAEQASPADAIPLDPPEPIAPTGWRPGRRATEIGLLLAILLHALVLTVAVAPVEWWRRKPPPQPIPVTIVMEEPKPPPPPPPLPPQAKPEPPPPPAPPAPAVPYAESGPDQVTRPAAPSEKPPTPEGPPPAPEPAPAPEPDPATEPPPAPEPEPKPTPATPVPETETAALPVPPPLPPAAKPTPPRPVPRPASKPKPPPKAPPVRGPTSPNASGQQMTGDIYLNRMRDMIARWLRYPRSAGLGRPVQAVTFAVAIDHGGQILDLRLAQTSGQRFFDMVAEEAIRRAAPYPPPPFLPADQPGIYVNVTVPPPP